MPITANTPTIDGANIGHWQERVDLAAALRWTARLNMHEAVVNHFSLATNDEGTQFLMNPVGKHFSRVCASDLMLLDAQDTETMSAPRPGVSILRVPLKKSGGLYPSSPHLHVRPKSWNA